MTSTQLIASWPALTALIIGSVLGMFHCLRVIAAMARRPDEAACRMLPAPG